MVASVIDTPVSLAERIGNFRRHGAWMAAAFSGGLLVAIALAIFLPATYRSSATILIEQQEIPQDLVRSTVTSFADQRVQVISQRVMTSQNLFGIIERYDLYAQERRTKSRESLIERMRNDIKLKMISANVVDPRSGRPMQATIAFALSFESPNADLAAKVANELTSLYLNENLKMRTEAARQTATFLASSAEQLREDIAAIANKISEFKAAHVNTLPAVAQSNFANVDRTQLELRDVVNRIDSLDSQKVMLEAQLAQIAPTSQIFGESGQRILSPSDRLKTLKANLASLRARYGTNHPDIATTEREIAGLQAEVSADAGANDVLRQLESARTELAAARQRYSADHPDVLRLQRTVASLEEQAKAAPAIDRVQSARRNPDNPAYLQVKTSLDTIAVERAAAQRKAAELRATLDDFQRRLSQGPEVEREFQVLARDYDNAQAKYQEVRTKQREAESAQNLETERKGERFTLIEPPQRAEEPISPNRPAVLLVGLVLSLGIAFAVSVARDAFDGSVRSARDITRLLEVAPLASIPYIENHDDTAQRARRWRMSWWGVGAGLIALVLVVHFVVRPLDLVWLSLLRRFGL